MKGKKEDKALRELFRNKLENAEIIPSGSLNSSLMRMLRRKEFVHFIPSRFNIWYLGGAVATGVALALILISGSGGKEDIKHDALPEIINESEITISNNPAVSQSPSVVQAPDKKQNIVAGRKKKVSEGNAIVSNEKGQTGEQEKLTSVPQNITGTINDKEIFGDQIEGKEKLQAGIRQVNNLIEASVTQGCTPLRVRFRDVSDSFESYRWTFGDGGYSDEKEPVWIFDVEGEYEVQLKVVGKDGAQSVASKLIKVHPQPLARFEITPENAIIPDDEIVFHNYSSSAVKYKWDFGDGNSSELFEPRHTYRQFGNYNIRLVASSEYGCTDTLFLANAFAGTGYYINFPNAFIPNPDGPSGGYYSPKSDEASHVFHPVFVGVSDYNLRIFSRLGILIFETNDINIGWDGYIKGQLSDQGVYIWKVRGSFVNGEPFTKMGDVTLLRN